jgi:hypothetical protein
VVGGNRVDISLFTTISKPVLRPIHTLILEVLGALSQRIRGQEGEADQYPPSRTEVS